MANDTPIVNPTPDVTAAAPTAQPTTPDYTVQPSQPAQLTPPQPSGPATAAPNNASTPGAASVMAGAPSTLVQSAQPHAHGLLGKIALSALGVLATTGRDLGKGIKTVAENSEYGQQLKQNALVRQAEQQKMQLAQQQEQRAEQTAQQQATKALDEHTEMKLRTNAMSLDNAHKVIENQHLENMYPGMEESQRNTLLDQHRVQDASDRDLLSTLESIGVHIDTSHGPGHDGLTQDDARAVGQGEQTMLNNGETGDKAGYGFVDNNMLRQTVLPHDVSVISDYTLDPKTGKISPVTTTLTGGNNTAFDALILHDSGSRKFQQLQTQYSAQLANEQKQTAIEKDRAEESETGARTHLISLQAHQYMNDNTPSVFGDTSINPANPDVPMSPKERDANWKTFNEKVLTPLQTSTDKSYQMARQAYDEYQKAGGKLPTGAQGMLMLSQHLSTTFGNVKGARVTKDMIQEHLGARSVPDSALVAVQRLTNGDPLSPDQWNAFMGLIGQSRETSYETAIDNARSNGLGKAIPAFLPQAPGKGSKIDPNTARIYIYAAHGNAQAARTAAQTAGWSF